MTEPGRPTEWDDERVQAAFAARAGRAIAPRDLTATSIEAVRAARRPGPLGALRPRAIGFATVAAVAAIAVAGIGLVTSPRGPAAATLLERVGLSPMTVSEAIAIRDLPNDDREIAVRGWFSPAPFMHCPAFIRVVSPIDLECPIDRQWLLERPQGLATNPPRPLQVNEAPIGPSIHLVLPYLDVEGLPADALVEVVVLGHFDDRRAILCEPRQQSLCRDNLVVDRIVSIDGVDAPASALQRLERAHGLPPVRPAWTVADVDAIVRTAAPGIEILARTAIPGERIGDIEPSLGTAALGVLDRPIAWVVTALQPRADQPPRLRTFVLVDDSVDETYEAVPWSESSVGFVPVRLLTPTHAPEERPTPPPATPNPTVITGDIAFPETWSGLPVRSVAEVVAALPRLDDGPSQAVAIKGWYVVPDPTIACPELQDPPGPVEQPCPEGRHWLLDAPERLWDDPGPPWIDREPTGAALNPIVPANTRFDIPNLWFDTGPLPLPVVVIGHFRDPRVAFGGDPDDLVVDALVWRAGQATNNAPLRGPRFTRDDPLAALIRIGRDVGPTVEMWLSVARGDDLAVADPSGPLPPELAEADWVWVARRLVERESGGHEIVLAYTADGSDRVWSSSLCCMVWLETRLLTALGGPPILETLDYPGDIVDIRLGTPEGAATWVNGQGPEETGEVMLGTIEGRPNELRIAWIGGECDRVWELQWWANSVLLWPREREASCRLVGIRREVVLTLDHPVDLESISVSNGGMGG